MIRLAAILALLGLSLVVWSILDPTPIAVIAAMSAGQAIGSLSLLLFLIAIVRDLRRARVFASTPPPPPASTRDAAKE